jgi:hypothetical protein
MARMCTTALLNREQLLGFVALMNDGEISIVHNHPLQFVERDLRPASATSSVIPIFMRSILRRRSANI